MRHLQKLNITLLPRQSNFTQLHRRYHSLPPCLWIVPATSLHLPIYVPGCLYKLPVLPLSLEVCLQPSCPKCCVNNLVQYRCLFDLAQLSPRWIPGHCDICPNEIADMLAKTSNNIPPPYPWVRLSARTRNSFYSSWRRPVKLDNDLFSSKFLMSLLRNWYSLVTNFVPSLTFAAMCIASYLLSSYQASIACGHHTQDLRHTLIACLVSSF